MSRACLLLPLLLALTACAPTPSYYGVPAQHKPNPGSGVAAAPPPQLGERMCAADDGADLYIVKDVKGAESSWRWTLAEPEFRFQLKPGSGARVLELQFGINDRTFLETGPLKLVFQVNGHEVDRQTYNTFGDHTWERRIGSELLAPGAENRVKIRVLNPWQAPDAGVQLGFVLRCVGFKSQ